MTNTPTPIPRHLDGWDIETHEESSPFRFRVVATHVSGPGASANGRDLQTALLDLARQIHVDRRELLTLYGLD